MFLNAQPKVNFWNLAMRLLFALYNCGLPSRVGFPFSLLWKDCLFWTSANSAPEAECYVTDLPEDALYYPIRREYKLFEFPDKDESRSTWVADVYVESASKQLLETFRLDDLCERNVVDITVTDKDGRTVFQYECEHPNETSWGLEGYIPRISGPWCILPKERPLVSGVSGVKTVHEPRELGW